MSLFDNSHTSEKEKKHKSAFFSFLILSFQWLKKNNIQLITASYLDTHSYLLWNANDPGDESLHSLGDLLYSTCWNLIWKTKDVAVVPLSELRCALTFFSNVYKKKRRAWCHQGPTDIRPRFFLLARRKGMHEQTVILWRSNRAWCVVTKKICYGGFKGCTLKIIYWGKCYMLCIWHILYCFCIWYLFIYYIVLFFIFVWQQTLLKRPASNDSQPLWAVHRLVFEACGSQLCIKFINITWSGANERFWGKKIYICKYYASWPWGSCSCWCRCEWSFTYTLLGHVPNLCRDLKDLDGRCILICPFVKGWFWKQMVDFKEAI